ncbi:hypothetical protein M5K25_013482 [Dendrobium thyrsiflorum]|uniref:Uncharacterized protein n=1 Tax=Dendrobium thyrsiflorum TaxID=117978 RepID=A0ABD0UTD2_DENTH
MGCAEVVVRDRAKAVEAGGACVQTGSRRRGPTCKWGLRGINQTLERQGEVLSSVNSAQSERTSEFEHKCFFGSFILLCSIAIMKTKSHTTNLGKNMHHECLSFPEKSDKNPGSSPGY